MSRLFVDVRPLRASRNFRFLFAGQVVSLLGSNLTVVAVPYQVYRETHSSLWVGLASLIQLPFLIAGSLWGGALGDRIDQRTLMIASSFFQGAVSVGLALNALSPHGHFALLLSLAAVAAGAAGFVSPLRAATIPRLLSADQLVAAYSLIQIAVNTAAVAGATDVISTVLRNTILQNAITDEFRSRISSIQMAVVTGGPRLGDVESGVVASLVSTEFSIVSGGIVCVLGALALVWRRRGFWRDETA